MKLTPLIDGGLFKYKWGAALEYTLFTIKHDEEVLVLRGKRNTNKYIKENPEAVVVDEEEVLESEHVLYHNLELAFQGIYDVCRCDKPIVFLGTKNNFREVLFPDYKKSRIGVPEPFYKQHIIDWLQNNFSTVECDGYEEDDGMAISQEVGKTCIICEDKDLHQVPGHQYNPVTKERRNISKREGDFWLYTQILTGDRTDDIPGIKGIGKVKAAKILEGAKSTKELYKRALDAWGGDKDSMHLTAQLVYMLRSDDDSYLKRKEVQ